MDSLTPFCELHHQVSELRILYFAPKPTSQHDKNLA